MNNLRNYLNHIKETLTVNDRALHLPNFLSDKDEVITWKDVETCLNSPSLYDIEIIDKNSSTKLSLPHYKKLFENNNIMEQRQIVDLFNQGNSVAILNYAYHNRKAAELLKIFEETFFVGCAIHVYCGLTGSKSFNVHEDFPCNFIIQIDGETHWKVYRNRVSQLFATHGYDRSFNEEELDIEIDIVLKPGDALYIPARAYHAAIVNGPRLSISIPCWTRMNLDSSMIIDRNYYNINIL
jgi:hypothetical protein